MNEHYDRIAAIADDLIFGLRKDREEKLSRMPTGKKSKAVYVPDADRQRKALRLVEECAEYFCPPPQQLIEALRLAFMDSERKPIRAKTIDEESSIRLLAGEAGIEPKSWRAFRLAAVAEAQDCTIAGNAMTFNASVNGVASAAGVDNRLIREWRQKPAYQREVKEAQGK